MGLGQKLAALSPQRKRALAILLVVGGTSGAFKLRQVARQTQRQLKDVFAGVNEGKGSSKKARIAVDAVFLKRLLNIMSICLPSPTSREALLVMLQGVILVSRTLLTDYISRVEGACGRAVVSLDFTSFGNAVLAFALVGVPAAVVNSGLKAVQKRIQLAFMERLTLHLHRQYTRNRAYYAATTLGGLTYVDQRITEDVEKFAFSISELYGHTFKPLLDVVLFTRSLAQVMGYKGQFALYAYYLGVAALLKALSPPLAQMAANEATLTGGFRAAHQRLASRAEEVAFNDPPGGVAEQLILNKHLRRLVGYARSASFLRFLQQIADGYCIKYLASVVSLLMYAAPLYWMPPEARPTQGQLMADYIRSMRLLQNTSRGIGDLVLVYKRVTGLASHTSRVAELLEQVNQLSATNAEHSALFKRDSSSTNLLSSEAPPPRRLHGATISFHRVSLFSPDGSPLVRELSFEVRPGCSVMLMGPNGCGKSSLLRVMAGLWPLQIGDITTPDRSAVFYLSQTPYLVDGTLRDQLLYPEPPTSVWASATPSEQIQYATVSGRDVVGSAEDERLEACLRAVELEYLLQRTGGGASGWDQARSWAESLSGGERQRLAMARLLYHRPKYAVLDECTSAVNIAGEHRLYAELQRAGITFLSIGHRPALRNFHQRIVHFEGNAAPNSPGWWIEDVPPPPAADGAAAGTATAGNGAAAAAQ